MWARIPTSFAQRPPGTFSPTPIDALMAGFGGTRRRKAPADANEETKPLTPAELAAACRAQALRMLERRSHSRSELARRLAEKGHLPEVAAETIERLVGAGLVNDAIYAGQVARTYLVGRRSSVRRVQQEMMRRGIERTLADDAIAEVRADEGLETEDASVERAARQKLKSLTELDPLTRARRLTGFLARRGFSGEVIRAALRRLDREAADEGDEGNGGDVE